MKNAFWGVMTSKTMWVSVGAAMLPFISQPAQDFIKAHPGPAAIIVGAGMALLRFYTTQSITEKGAVVVAKRAAAAEDTGVLPPTPPETPK